MTRNETRSVAELHALALVQIDARIPIRLYIRSANLLFKQAKVYQQEGDLVQSYIWYLKYTNLGIFELPRHPQYRKAEYKAAINDVQRSCLAALELLETLKPVLHSAYAEQNIANPYTHAETSGDEFPPAIAEKKHKSPGYQDKTQVGVGLDAEKTHVEPDVTLGSHHQAWSRPIEDNCFKQHVRSHADDQKMAMINNNCTLAKRKTDTVGPNYESGLTTDLPAT
ncbi:hypothetical protein DFQ28_011659 [Apophysomyces sp. BC1034]|nr:hypothetical protein DFQ28_011659 [Apophysomyces sp. BC1034]